MAANSNGNAYGFNDPYLGLDDGDAFMGAGEQSLFAEAFGDDPIAPYRSPQDLFDFGPLEPANAAQASNPPQAAQASGNADPQRAVPFAEAAPVDPALQGPILPLMGNQEPVPSPQNQSPYPIQPLRAGTVSALGAQFPTAPIQAQGNGTNQAAGQMPAVAPLASNAMPYGQPGAPQFAMYPNMPQQFMPQGAQAQGFAVPTFGYQGNAALHPAMPMHMQMQMMQGYPLPASPYQAQVPVPNQPAQLNQPAASAVEGKKLTHNRRLKGDPKNDPSQIYSRPTGLGPWGPLVDGDEDQPHHLFEYFRTTAELKPGITLSKDQLWTFFLGSGHPNPNRRLTLWIQSTAAQCNDRYASGANSGKCRYEGCLAGQRTILKGFYRVAFDEFSNLTGTVLDPMHSAGYMHLHCFEKLFDLGYLVHYGAAKYGFRVRPDTRNFQFETRNPASITRDHQEMINAYNEWVTEQKARVDLIESQNATKPLDQRYTGSNLQVIPRHEQRLGSALTEKHLKLQVRGRSIARQQRGGVHIELHRGDLELYNRLKRRVTLRKRQEAQGEPEDEDEVQDQIVVALDDEDEEGEQQQQNQRMTRSRAAQAKTTGRKRSAESSDGSSSHAKRAKRDHNQGNAQVNVNQNEDAFMLDDSWFYGATAPHQLGPLPSRPSPHAPQSTLQLPQYQTLHVPTLQIPPQPTLQLYPPQPPHQQQLQQAHQLHHQPQPHHQPHHGGVPVPHRPATTAAAAAAAAAPSMMGPRTRKRSREAGSDILDMLSSRTHLTRSSAHEIQGLLGDEPRHVRDQVLAAVPEYAAAVLQPGGSSNNNDPQVLYNDQLEERVGRLSKRQRREMDAFTQKREKGLDSRRFHSF